MKRFLVLALVLVSACADNKPPPPVAPLTATKGKAAEPTAAAAASQPAVDAYSYSPVGKRDPFRPYYVDAQLTVDRNDSALTELERFETDQLKLVAILSGTSQPQAMFEDPDGIGHLVKQGTAIGRNGGHVTKIKKDEVVILEEYRDPAGNKAQSPLTVKLPGDELLVQVK